MKRKSLIIVAAATVFTAFADLPAGYKQLEYIDTDGNQWVNTRFLPACTNAVEIKASFTNTTTGSAQYLFCSQRSTEGTDRKRFYLNISGSGKSEFGFRNSAGGSASISPSVPHVFFAAPDKTDIYTEVEDAYYLTGFVDGRQAGNKVPVKILYLVHKHISVSLVIMQDLLRTRKFLILGLYVVSGTLRCGRRKIKKICYAI